MVAAPSTRTRRRPRPRPYKTSPRGADRGHHHGLADLRILRRCHSGGHRGKLGAGHSRRGRGAGSCSPRGVQGHSATLVECPSDVGRDDAVLRAAGWGNGVGNRCGVDVCDVARSRVGRSVAGHRCCGGGGASLPVVGGGGRGRRRGCCSLERQWGGGRVVDDGNCCVCGGCRWVADLGVLRCCGGGRSRSGDDRRPSVA